MASASTAAGGTIRATDSCGTATITASASLRAVVELELSTFDSAYRRAELYANACAV
jgi:hypothetical protein